MIEAGDKVRAPISEPTYFGSGQTKKILKRGVVEYVHPAGRYITVRFQFGGGSWLESYPPEEVVR